MRVHAATNERDSLHRIFTAINQIRPALYIGESCPATIEQIGILANRRIPENEAASMLEFGWLVLFAAPSQALHRLLPADLIDGLDLAESRSGTQTILYGGKDWPKRRSDS